MLRVLGACLLQLLCGAVMAGPMTVKLVPPTSLVKVMTHDAAWDVFIDGEFDAQAAARFSAEIRRLRGEPAVVHLNSPGGNLMAGLAIGEAIRRAGYNTSIGRSAPDGSVAGPEHSQPGICMSACTFAFLGGVYRDIDIGSQFGVHRVSRPETSPDDLDVGQVITARVAQYVHDMGADEGFVGLYTSVPKESIHLLTAAELTALKVVNNGKEPAEWTVKFTEAGPYLRGMQKTLFGLGKAVMYCDSARGRVVFHPIYSTEFAPSIASKGWFHSILVDNDTLAVQPREIVNDKGYLNTEVDLTEAQARRFIGATMIGYAMQISREAPSFVGFRIDVDREAQKQIEGFVKNCLSQRK